MTRILVVISSLLLLFTANAKALDKNSKGLAQLLSERFHFSEKKNSAVAVFDLREGQYVFQSNAAKSLKPASVLKILTSLVAFKELGPGFKFKTELWTEDFRGSRARILYVKGGGDPSFTTEDMWLLARRVKLLGIESIGQIRLDDSIFFSTQDRQGIRSYQAGTSALSLNYNTVTFEVCPTQPGKAAKVTIDPWELGITMRGKISTTRQGRGVFSIDEDTRIRDLSGKRSVYVLRGNIGRSRKCEQVYRAIDDPVYYFASVFKAYLQMLGVRIDSDALVTKVPKNAKLLYTQYSKSLSSIIQDLNLYSSNFMADQVITTVGGDADGHLDLDRGTLKAEDFLSELGFAKPEFSIMDGSGLSHANRLSARIIVRLLAELQEVENFKPEFEASLPVSMRNGTLKTRRFGRRQNILVRAKTGTLNGVSSLAGYITAKTGRKYAFAIIQNDVPSKPKAEVLENRLVETIYYSR